MLHSKKPLQAKTSLKSKAILKSKAKPVKQKKPMVSKLKKEADKWFSLYVRYRDGKFENGEWYSQCITSGEWMPLKKAQAGHFISRRYNATRFEEENVNAQSYRDNVLFNGEQYKYAIAVDLKYGDGTAKKLSEMAKESHQFTVEELQTIIDDAKEQVKYYQEHHE
jgi:hypothetical protein